MIRIDANARPPPRSGDFEHSSVSSAHAAIGDGVGLLNQKGPTMFSNQSASLAEPHLVPPPELVSTGYPALRLWLAKIGVLIGTDARVDLLLALDTTTGDVLAWRGLQRRVEIADVEALFADAFDKGGATHDSQVLVTCDPDRSAQVLEVALRASPILPCSVCSSAQDERRMRFFVAEVEAVIECALRFELAQADVNDGPLSVVAIEHLIEQVLYWHHRRHPREQPSPGSGQ